MTIDDQEQVRAQVRDTYAAAAAGIAVGEAGPGCNALAELAYGGSCGAALAGAVTASLGCGSPTELVDLQPGQRVVDLGSGGGLDALLAARRVGPAGQVIGVDMTPQMLALAEANRAAAGLDNVEFRQGYIEDLPVDDGSADVVISNCVLSLSVDKPRVLAEAWRVLVPGGRLAVTDLAALVVANASPASRASLASPSEMPSITPRAAAGARRGEVTRLGSSAVGTSCPTSASRLAAPMPATPGRSHFRMSSPTSAGGTTASLTSGSLPPLVRATGAVRLSSASRVRRFAARPRGCPVVGCRTGRGRRGRRW